MKREFTSISRLCYHSYLAENLSCTKLRSGSTFIFLGKLIPAQQGESKSLPFSTIPEYLNYVCLRIDRNNVVASLLCAFTWLPWHQTDLKLNTRPSQPHTMHISRYITGIPRMWTESGKSRYTVKRVPLTKNRLRGPFVARKKRSSEAILTKGGDFSTLWKTFFILQLQVYDTE